MQKKRVLSEEKEAWTPLNMAQNNIGGGYIGNYKGQENYGQFSSEYLTSLSRKKY